MSFYDMIVFYWWFVLGVLGIHGDPHEQLGNIALSLKEIDSPVKIAPGSKNLTLARPLDKEGVLGPSSVYVNVICDRKRTSDPVMIGILNFFL